MIATLVRASAVTARDLTALRHFGYWLVVVSGFLEPVLYLFSIGVGVGSLVGDIELADGTVVGYAAFVAPAMLAASAMNAALAESTFNFFAKLKWVRLYEAMVATPLRPVEIALGELGWAMLRGSLYTSAFLALMVGMGLTTVWWAFTALFAGLLIGFAFGTVGMVISTLIRTHHDFDYLGLVQFALFLFSGTFAPVTAYPLPLRILVELTPLYHGVGLLRELTTGSVSWAAAGHTAYLVVLATVALAIAGRRITRLLCA
jgi:lipooligosaccharide transport system permease protein